MTDIYLSWPLYVAYQDELHAWVQALGVPLRDVRVPSVIVISNDSVKLDVYVRRDERHVQNGDRSGVLITTVTVPLVAPWPLAPGEFRDVSGDFAALLREAHAECVDDSKEAS